MDLIRLWLSITLGGRKLAVYIESSELFSCKWAILVSILVETDNNNLLFKKK